MLVRHSLEKIIVKRDERNKRNKHINYILNFHKKRMPVVIAFKF